MSRETVQFAEMVRAAFASLERPKCERCKRPLHYVNRTREWVCVRCELAKKGRR